MGDGSPPRFASERASYPVRRVNGGPGARAPSPDLFRTRTRGAKARLGQLPRRRGDSGARAPRRAEPEPQHVPWAANATNRTRRAERLSNSCHAGGDSGGASPRKIHYARCAMLARHAPSPVPFRRSRCGAGLVRQRRWRRAWGQLPGHPVFLATPVGRDRGHRAREVPDLDGCTFLAIPKQVKTPWLPYYGLTVRWKGQTSTFEFPWPAFSCRRGRLQARRLREIHATRSGFRNAVACHSLIPICADDGTLVQLATLGGMNRAIGIF